MDYVVAFVVFLGLLLGRLLSRIVKDEVERGKRYLLALQRFILITLSLTFLYLSWLDNIVVLTFFIGIISSFVIKERYFYFGLAVAILSLLTRDLLLTYSSMIFMYGLSYGSLNKGILKRLVFYMIPFIVLLLPFTVGHYYLFLSFISGALIFRE